MRSRFRLYTCVCLAVALVTMSDGANARAKRISCCRTSGPTLILNNAGSSPTPANPIDAASSSDTGSAASGGFRLSHAPIDLSISQSAPDTSSNSGGGLNWGAPLSTDLVNLGVVHARLHYFNQNFSQSGANSKQRAVGLNFSIQY